MADNQREMERREKRANKDRRNKKIIWSVIAVVVLILIIMKIFEINVNSVIDRFTDEDGNFTLTEGVVEDNFPYSIDSSSNVSVVNINNQLGILTPSSFTVLNNKNGEVKYGFEHGYSNPILETEGVYSLIYDQGAGSYRLDTVSNAVYEEKLSNSILCADVAKDGTAAVATTSSEKLCDILVYSKSLEKEMQISISDGYVIAISLSENGKKFAAAVITGENANLKTTVLIYDVADGETDRETVELPQGLIIDMNYTGRNIIVVGDTYAGTIDSSGKYEQIYAEGKISTQCVEYTPSGDLVLVYNSYDNSTENVISYIKKSGRIKKEISVTGSIKSVSASSSLVSVLTNSEIISYNLSNGEEKSRLSTDDSARSICCMGSEIFVHRQSLIERNEADIN